MTPQTILAFILGDKENMEEERYFMIVTLLTASIFLLVLCIVNIIMNLKLAPVFFAGGSSLLMLGLYYFVRFKKCLFYPKLILTLMGLVMLDFTWYAKYLSNGPVLFFILIFSALVIWVWEGRSLAIMLAHDVKAKPTKLQKVYSVCKRTARSQDIMITL